MQNIFKTHYTREEAQALLPQVKIWLDQLTDAKRELDGLERKLEKAIGLGDDLGGTMVNRSIRLMYDIREFLQRFAEREIQIKDLDRGLIDFPAFVGGREVFLCWEKGEDDIEFWHDLDTGYTGREKL
jgi:hypothetical protein